MHAGLHAREVRAGSSSSDVVHVLREVDDDRDVAALAGEAGAAAAGEIGAPMLAADRDRLRSRRRRRAGSRRRSAPGGSSSRRWRRGRGCRGRSAPRRDRRRRSRASARGRRASSTKRRCGAVEAADRGRPAYRSHQTAKRSASARLQLEAEPGPDRSGAARRRAGSRTPSKSMRSMRAWSWKYSRCRTRRRRAAGVRRAATGAQCAESGRSNASHERRRLQEAGDAAAARGVGLQHVDRAGLEHAPEVRQVVAVLAGRDLHAGGRAVAQKPQPVEVVGRHRLLEPASRPLSAKRSRPVAAPACARRRRSRRRKLGLGADRLARRVTRSRSASGSRPTFIFTRGMPCVDPAAELLRSCRASTR